MRRSFLHEMKEAVENHQSEWSWQKHELEELLHVYKNTLMNLPGCAHLTKHTIETEDSTSIRLPPYQLPHAYWEAVNQELEEMETHGIIQPATSEWAAPIMIARKKDRAICLCVDYRHNALPIGLLGTCLNKDVFRVAANLQLSGPICRPHLCLLLC